MGERWAEELFAAARSSLPAPVWRYVAAGAREELSLGEAVEAWRSVRFLPRVLRDVREVDLTTQLHGSSYALPVGIAPTSLQRCAHPDGEIAMAQAAGEAGVPHVVSSNAGHLFADIAAVGAPWWLQAYVTEHRSDCLPMLDAAGAAGAGAVVLTLDTPFAGTKYDLAESDFAGVDLSWHRANYGRRVVDGQAGRWARDLAPDDVALLADRTGLPVVVKGVLHPDDARLCLEAGAAGIWVSNHGGRQLDRAQSTAAALPAVVAAVAGRVPVYVDGGIRSGLDVLAALTLGADAVFLGRLPYAALAAGGASKVAEMLGILGAELGEAMRLAGVASVAGARDARGQNRPNRA